MRKFACVAALIAAGGVSAQQGAAGEAACIAAVKASLRDPGSMQLVRVTRDAEPFKVAIDGRERAVRGYEVVVNARNGFGGYTGNQGWACITDAADERRVVRLVAPS